MNNKSYKNKQGGFIDIIIVIVIVLILMRYFNITITGMIDWLDTTPVPDMAIGWLYGASEWLKNLVNGIW